MSSSVSNQKNLVAGLDYMSNHMTKAGPWEVMHEMTEYY